MNRQSEEFEASLNKIREMLTSGQMMTAPEMGMHLNCTTPAIYNKLRAMKKRGFVFQTVRLDTGIRGQRPTAYAIVKAPKKTKRASA